MFKLTQSNLATIFAVKKEKDDDGFYSLSSLRADTVSKKVYASNGHSLYRSEMGESQDLEKDGPEVFLPAVLVAKAEKNAKKGEEIEVYFSSWNIRLSVNHGKSQDIVDFEKDGSKKYPDVEHIFKSLAGEAVAQTVVGVEELEVLVKVMKKAGAESVRLKLTGRTDPVEVCLESVGIDGIIMPFIMSEAERLQAKKEKA